MDPTSIEEKLRVRSLVELNFAVVLFAITGLFAKIVPLPVPSVIFGRSAVAALALLAYSLVMRTPIRPVRRGDLAVLLGLGVLLAVHWVTYFQAIRVSTVAVGIISLHVYPIITVLAEPIAEGKRIRLPDVLLALVVLAGILILVGEFSITNTTSQGVLWGTVSAVAFTGRNLVIRRFIQRYSGATLMLYQTAASAIVLLPFIVFTGGMGDAIDEWPTFLLLGTVFTAFTQSLYAGSLKRLSAKTVSIVATLLPLHAAILAAIFLGEIPTLRTVIGGVVVLGAVLVETIRAAGKSAKR